MNINQLNALIPESFEYTDALTGQTDTINLQLKRMSFGVSTSKAFKQAMEDQDEGAMSEILSKLIGSWDLDADGADFPPNAENILACPTEFIAKLAETVFKTLFPNPTNANDSANGSEPETSSLATSTTDSSSDGN